jgi:hypothetical protein
MFSAPVDRAGFQGMMDAIFWKGDFIQCIQVTGDIIKAMLDLSRQLQEEEDNGLETDYSSGWALATLGLNEDAKDPATRLIGGAYIDTKKLYSIAITDYLANGDTGYPMLQKAQPAPADRWSQTKLQSLSEAISKQVLDGTLPGHLKATDFLDSALRPIPPAPPSIGLSDLANNLFHNRAGDIAQSNTLEGKTQQRMRWSIDLYKADGSFSLFAHHGSETELGQQFPGVTTVDLSSPNTQTISFDYMFRIQRFTERGSFYLESDLNYGHKANRTATNVFQRSDTADYYNHEFGYAPGLWPRRQNPSSLKLLIPVASRMQLWPPITQITPGAGEKGAKAVASQAPVNYTVSFRPGLRFDYGYPKPSDSTAAGGSSGGKGQTGQIQTGQIWNSFFETGYEVGRLFNGPSAYEFMPVPGASNLMVTCTVYQVSCIETAPTASPSTYPGYAIRVFGGRDHTQSGFYVDFRFDIPLPRRLGLSAVEFVTENRGDFYVFGSPGDSPVDARLYDDLKSSLNIPILRKLSLAPTFEWIVFRNKAGDPFARSMGGTANTYYAINTFVSLTYSFGWHSGLEWKKVLGFNNQAPPLSSLPTR